MVALSDAAGALGATQRFDAWGNVIASTGAIPLYGYTGREPDATGLVYYRARYYDPTVGVFTQKDPARLRGGMNRYAYIGGHPVNSVDPMGLTASPPSVLDNASYYGRQILSNALGFVPGWNASGNAMANFTSGNIGTGLAYTANRSPASDSCSMTWAAIFF